MKKLNLLLAVTTMGVALVALNKSTAARDLAKVVAAQQAKIESSEIEIEMLQNNLAKATATLDRVTSYIQTNDVWEVDFYTNVTGRVESLERDQRLQVSFNLFQIGHREDFESRLVTLENFHKLQLALNDTQTELNLLSPAAKPAPDPWAAMESQRSLDSISENTRRLADEAEEQNHQNRMREIFRPIR